MISNHDLPTTVSTIPSLSDYHSLDDYLQVPEPLAGLPLCAISLSLGRCEGIMGIVNCILEDDGNSRVISNSEQYTHYLEVFQVTLDSIHKSLARSIEDSKGWQPTITKDRGQGFVVNLVFDGLNLSDALNPNVAGPNGFPVNAVLKSLEQTLSVISGMLRCVEDGEVLLTFEDTSTLFYFISEQFKLLRGALDKAGSASICFSLGGAS